MSLDPSRSLPPLKSFALTHILYDPTSHLSIPLTLISLSPIFLFVSYFTLLIWTRRLTIAGLALGSIGNEVLSLVLKRIWKGDRPYKGLGEVGRGYGMPSSHSQAAGFLLAWGVGYALTIARRGEEVSGGGIRGDGEALKKVRAVRTGIYIFGLGLWSILVAYSRWYLRYHSAYQVIAGYSIGLLAGSAYFTTTEYIPLRYPSSPLAQLRRGVEWVWTGVGGVGGWRLGDAPGGWGEGHFFLENAKGLDAKDGKSL